MKIIIRSTLVFILVLAATTHGLSLGNKTSILEKFEFQNQKYSLIADFSPPRADIILRGRTSINLSAGMDGENIPLTTRISENNFYVFWLNYKDASIRLAFYDFQRDRSQVLGLSGFSFIAAPEVIKANNGQFGLLFLGNRSDNDDIFYYEPETDLLTPLTATPFSEKGFKLLKNDGRLEIETRSHSARYRYSFDPLRHECVILEKRNLPARQKNTASTNPAYYNTYIGFGDSITWGEMEGEQHLESCYLTQMKTLLADPTYANYYGSSDSINLGIPGERTLDGAERVYQDLVEHQGLYFLLMMGVNDVININCSIDSSLENLGYIVDAAKAGGRRVIISTLTPSKSIFSLYAYYWENLQDLSTGILALAREKNVAGIDTLSAFMNTNPPNGWQDLLENIIPYISSGNHPNAAGNRIIAGLFADALAAFPPQPPGHIVVLNPTGTHQKNVSWDPNYESDFSHFVIEFAFSADRLTQRLTTSNNFFTFNLFPFLPQMYFRLQSVDRGSHASVFSTIFSAQAENFSSAQQRRRGKNGWPVPAGKKSAP
ncbi:MAG: SGNH/GDSL hydrolase family protein [Candidatus Aminicenantes bacterium]|nr:SGNH/GDSL hydrolase family protein [Candidatus Aminicenantes bacterium]